jgi:hypothetical protein
MGDAVAHLARTDHADSLDLDAHATSLETVRTAAGGAAGGRLG